MTIAVILDKKKLIKTGENAGRHHIKIRLTYTVDKKTVQKYYCSNVFATPEEFIKITRNPGKSKELQAKQTTVNALYEKAKSIINNNPFIDAESFGLQLLSRGNYKDPLGFMMAYVEELEQRGQIGTRDYYKLAHNSFKEFFKIPVSFAFITPKKLLEYEDWMVKRGRSITTVGMYCIALRTVFNMAISQKIISPDLYPFGEGRYVIPTAKGRKIAVQEDKKDKLLKYATLNIDARKAVDFWILSYFSNGMNMADVAHLRYKNIVEDMIIFERVKTTKTQRKRVSIIVILRGEVKSIIDRWGNKSNNPNDYIFPILRDGLTPAQIKERIRDFVFAINKGLKIACNDLKIPAITTYSARHTFATIARNKGASTEFIQEALGHSDSKTTKAYLDSFDIETKRKVANLL